MPARLTMLRPDDKSEYHGGVPLTWFDAHLDLAYLAVSGRDMLAPLDQAGASAGPHPPAAVTLPALADGNIRLALGTIFTEPDGTGPEGYAAGDVERANAVGRAQLEVYLTWRDRGAVAVDVPRVLRPEKGVGQVRAGMGVSEAVPVPLEQRLARLPAKPPLHLGILIENADPIRSPDDLDWWTQRGVVAIGLAWVKPSRYAGGNTTDVGLTDLGRRLAREMDRLGVVHDASHLSDRALAELLDAAEGPVMASHSNCRALLGDPTNQRHLTDEAIRRITEHSASSGGGGGNGGVIGLNLYSKFLRPGLPEGGRASISDCVRHIEHVCEVAGDRRHVGLGSDMDGGFSAARLPEGIDRPRDLQRLGEALSAGGWSDDEVGDFAWRNWARFWSSVRRT